MKKIIIVGDIHADWSSLNKLISRKRPDIIISTGDFGWWPHFDGKTGLLGGNKKFHQDGIKNKLSNGKNVKIFFIGGNHENWDSLDEIANKEPNTKIHQVLPGIFYCENGTILEIEGKKFFMMGGADSIDKDSRILGISWWRQETIRQKDVWDLPDEKIDVVISHTVPKKFITNFSDKFRVNLISFHKYKDPSSLALDVVLDKYNPDWWFSSHFHVYMEGVYMNKTKWIGLDMTYNYGKWWYEFKAD